MTDGQAEAPEEMSRVLKRVFRGRDGETVLAWLQSISERRLLNPVKEPTELGYYQGRFSLYRNIINEMEKEDGRTDPIIAPTE